MNNLDIARHIVARHRHESVGCPDYGGVLKTVRFGAVVQPVNPAPIPATLFYAERGVLLVVDGPELDETALRFRDPAADGTRLGLAILLGVLALSEARAGLWEWIEDRRSVMGSSWSPPLYCGGYVFSLTALLAEGGGERRA